MNNSLLKSSGIHRLCLSTCLFLILSLGKTYGQFYGVGIDILGTATTTFNIEGSMALSQKWSMHIPLQYNPWTFNGNKKIKQVTIQPGIRLWSGDSYSQGWFFGVNSIISRYNIGGFFGSHYQRDGWGYGGGLSTGYSYPVFQHFNMEFEVGVGALWIRYDKYRCEVCGELIAGDVTKWTISPNKAAIKLIYLF